MFAVVILGALSVAAMFAAIRALPAARAGSRDRGLNQAWSLAGVGIMWQVLAEFQPEVVTVARAGSALMLVGAAAMTIITWRGERRAGREES
ncbi:MAG: hypothetical protein IPK24_24990 [Kineosporiaceae bacterium]|nr:hypothetical protein [Kineosporiaceae bacterium]MBK8078709.1 hypothetical protein [Kineosporiaceae bacterium]